MRRQVLASAIGGALVLFAAGRAAALTRDIQAIPAFRLTFGQSVLNQLSYETYRDPYDELQSRPYNLLFANIGRHANLSPWPGQEGGYARYVDGLIGNNGTANVDNNADAIQGAMVRRETGSIAWGVSAAFLSGTIDSDATGATTAFSDGDALRGIDVRGGAAFRINETNLLGAGIRTILATQEATDDSFEQGTGGFSSVDRFNQIGLTADVGWRRFLSELSSWEVQGVLGYGTSKQDEFSDSLDAAGVVTDRFVATNWDLADLSFGVTGSYNRLAKDRPGETEYRGGLLYAQRGLSNSNLSYSETGGVVTPSLTLVSDSPVARKELFGSAKTIFQAGETEMFLGGRLSYAATDGSTRTDAAGTIVNEKISDSEIALGLVLGVRQPLYRDKLRIIVSGRGDVLDTQTKTTFDTGSQKDHSTLTVAQYAVGLEAVLSNVTLDLAWLAGEEASVVPVPVGIPSGSRRTVELDRLVFSAAVAW